MKNVGIITLNGYFNYGNRLQNYALQEVLKSYDCNVETILVDHKKMSRTSVQLKNELKKILKVLLGKTSFKDLKASNLRQQRFYNFSKQFINESNYYISDNNLPDKLNDSFDYFITGSDQVWNPEYNFKSSIYFLGFAPRVKSISYAASFGISEIPSDCIENYRDWLNDISNISVREEAGAKIIKDLTGRNASVVLDPTLLLTRDDWLAISKESSNKPKKRYLLTYFLGNVSKENRDKIDQIAQTEDLEIVQLANIKDKSAFAADPSEFIDYINSSEVFLTDSFHGSVFSILLEKPFVVFEREGSKNSMNSRIDTLLRTFELEQRKWENISNNKEVFNIDYSNVPEILEIERKRSLLFIEKSIGLNS